MADVLQILSSNYVTVGSLNATAAKKYVNVNAELFEGAWKGKYADGKAFTLSVSNVQGFRAQARYEGEGTLSFFLVNRHGTEAIDVEVSLQGFAAGHVIDHQVMTHTNLEAVNTARNQTEVAPRKGSGAKAENGTLSVKLPPYSYQMVRVKV